MTHLIPLESYKDFDKILELAQICNNEMSHINWDNIKADLLSQPIDVIPSNTVRWMEHIANVGVGEVGYRDNNRELELCVPEMPEKVGSWFYISLKDGYQTRTDHKPFINAAFKNTMEYVSTLSKAVHVSINIFSPHMISPDHTDGFPDYNSILLTFKTSKNNPENVVASINGEEFIFKDREFFVFDPEIPHSGVNTSDDDWCFLIIRIDKSEFSQ